MMMIGADNLPVFVIPYRREPGEVQYEWVSATTYKEARAWVDHANALAGDKRAYL